MSEIKNPGKSIRAKLLNVAKQKDVFYQTILTRYFQERLLYRISQTHYRENFYLKGGALIDVEAIIPGGVLCLFSAWNVHGLTTSLPQAYHVAVKRGRKITLPTFPKIELHHITDTMFDIGVEELVVSGYHIHIYNKERCVCDAVKYRNKIGMDVCSEVVNNYISQPDRNLSLLMDYADKLRVKRILEQYIAIKL